MYGDYLDLHEYFGTQICTSTLHPSLVLGLCYYVSTLCFGKVFSGCFLNIKTVPAKVLLDPTNVLLDPGSHGSGTVH